MKKIFTKKMALPLIAGIMTTVIALAGTFAWFTSSANATDGKFKTAIVKLNYDKGENNVWNFYPGHKFTIDAQRELELAVTGKSQEDADDALLAWWNSHQQNGVDPDWYFPNETLNEGPKAGFVNFLHAPNEDTFNGYSTKVTPGSFIYRHYDFVNASNVPVYFRVKKAEVTGDPGVNIPYAAYMCIGSNPKYELLEDGGDGYLYCLEPLKNGEVVKLMMHAYLTGENGNSFQDVTISFGSVGAELIQATNNAVSLIGSWADLPYVPYAPAK